MNTLRILDIIVLVITIVRAITVVISGDFAAGCGWAVAAIGYSRLAFFRGH